MSLQAEREIKARGVCALLSTTAMTPQTQPMILPGKPRNTAHNTIQNAAVLDTAHYWGRGNSSLRFSSALLMNCSVVSSLGGSQKMALPEQTEHWELWHFGVCNKAQEFQGVCCECTPRTSQSYFMPARSDKQIKSMVLIVQKLPAKYAQPLIFLSFLNEMHGCQTNQGL